MANNRKAIIADSFPTSARIGAVDYHLDFSEIFSENLGETDPNVASIKVSRGLPAGKFAVTLIHELCHSVVEEFGILQGTPLQNEKDEEAVVVRLATGIATLLQNNQGLFFKILHTLDSGIMDSATAVANAESRSKTVTSPPKKRGSKDEPNS